MCHSQLEYGPPCDPPVAKEHSVDVACRQFSFAAWVKLDEMFVPPDMDAWNVLGISIDEDDAVRYTVNGQHVAQIVDDRVAIQRTKLVKGLPTWDSKISKAKRH